MYLNFHCAVVVFQARDWPKCENAKKYFWAKIKCEITKHFVKFNSETFFVGTRRK